MQNMTHRDREGLGTRVPWLGTEWISFRMQVEHGMVLEG